MEHNVITPKEESYDVLFLDIETAPILANVWSLWKQNVSLNQIKEDTYIMCVSAKWMYDDEMLYAEARTRKQEKAMLKKVWDWLDRAKFVVMHNGKRFDTPKLNAAFILNGFPPPSPYTIIDTLEIAKKNFRFTSNKLEYLAKALQVEEKSAHEQFSGFELWKQCMLGNKLAWEEMKKYNEQDVKTLELVYHKLKAWFPTHPRITEKLDCCPRCGGTNINARGTRALASGLRYQRYRCMDCGSWLRDNHIINPKEERRNRLTSI